MKSLGLLFGTVFCLLYMNTHAIGKVVVIPVNKTTPVNVGIEIKSVPATISSPGFYYITKNLICPAQQDCIHITVPDVTLDLMGFALTGPCDQTCDEGNYSGVIFEGNGRSSEVKNGSINYFPGYAIFQGVSFVGESRVLNVRATGNLKGGIHLFGPQNMVSGCSVDFNGGEGIYVGEHSLVTGNVSVSNQGNGITIEDGSTVTGNTSNRNSGYGLYLYGNSLVDQNTAYGNTTANSTLCRTCTFGVNHIPSL